MKINLFKKRTAGRARTGEGRGKESKKGGARGMDSLILTIIFLLGAAATVYFIFKSDFTFIVAGLLLMLISLVAGFIIVRKDGRARKDKKHVKKVAKFKFGFLKFKFPKFKF